jgi:hypothetical protein
MSANVPTLICTLDVIFYPFNIGQKVGHQLLNADKLVTSFRVSQVLVVAFAALVIVAHNPLTIAAIKQTVFQAMRSLWCDLWQLPNNHLNHCAIRQNRLAVENPLCFHIWQL